MAFKRCKKSCCSFALCCVNNCIELFLHFTVYWIKKNKSCFLFPPICYYKFEWSWSELTYSGHLISVKDKYKCLFHRPSRKQSGTRQDCLTALWWETTWSLWWRTGPQFICMYGQSLWGHVVITQPVLCDPGLLTWVEREGWFPLWSN